MVNGGATISFEVPGSVNGAPLQGTVRLDARWGSPGSDGKCNVDADSNCTSKDSKITVTGSELTASVTDVLPNETITITGNGYGSQTCIGVDNIQLDGVALQVDEESTIRCDVDGRRRRRRGRGSFQLRSVCRHHHDLAGSQDLGQSVADLRQSHAGRGGQRWLRRFDHADDRGTHDLRGPRRGRPAGLCCHHRY